MLIKREHTNTANLSVFKSIFALILTYGHEFGVKSTSDRDRILRKGLWCNTSTAQGNFISDAILMEYKVKKSREDFKPGWSKSAAMLVATFQHKWSRKNTLKCDTCCHVIMQPPGLCDQPDEGC